MKTSTLTQHRHRAVALVMSAFLLMFMVMGCDPGGTQATSEEVQLTVDNWDDGAGKKVFEAYGGVNDKGWVEGNGLGETEQAYYMWRTLHGEHGDVTLSIMATPSEKNYENRVAEGTWTIVRGTGAYAGIEGSGKYVAKRDFNGGVKENFCGCCNGIFNH